MCYTSASSARATAIQALRSGVLILLVPSLVMMGGIVVLVYCYRNRFNAPPEWTDEHERELKEMLVRIEQAPKEGSGEDRPLSVVSCPANQNGGQRTADHGPRTMKF